MIISMFIHVAAKALFCSLYSCVIFHCNMCMTPCFYVLATVNSTPMNIRVHVSFWIMVFSGYAQEWGFRSYGSSVFSFLKEPPYCSPEWLYWFIFPPTMKEGFLFSTPSPAFIVYRFFLMMAILTSVRWYVIAVLICISLIISNIEHLFRCSLAYMYSLAYMSSLEKCLFRSSSHVLIVFLFLILSCMNCTFCRLVLCQSLHLLIFYPILQDVFSFCLWFPLLSKSFWV